MISEALRSCTIIIDFKLFETKGIFYHKIALTASKRYKEITLYNIEMKQLITSFLLVSKYNYKPLEGQKLLYTHGFKIILFILDRDMYSGEKEPK